MASLTTTNPPPPRVLSIRASFSFKPLCSLHFPLPKIPPSFSSFTPSSLTSLSFPTKFASLTFSPAFSDLAAGGGGGEIAGAGGDGGGGGGGASGGEAVLEEVAALESDAILLYVGGMTCGGCAASVKRILESQDQVLSATVYLEKETAVVWPVEEAKGQEDWQKQLGEKLASHLTTCGFSSRLQGDKKQ